MTYQEEMATQINGLEVALAAIDTQQNFAMANNIFGEDGKNGIKLSFEIMRSSIEQKLRLAKACLEEIKG